jgi:SAM-dependent methyltransferase
MSACPICGSGGAAPLFRQTDRLYHATAREFAVVRCESCGLRRLDPQPTPEELRQYYPESYWFAPDGGPAGRLEEAYRRIVLGDHVRFVESALRRSAARGPLLDVGSGGGLFLGMLRARGFRGVGLDVSPQGAAVAWRLQGVPTICAQLEKAPLRPGAFAAITMFHVLEHLPDPRAFLRAARNLLAPDGRLIVQIPNAASWQGRLLGRRWMWNLDVPRHLFDYRAADLEKLLDRCGFEVLRRNYFSLRDNPAGLASSLAPGLDPRPRRLRRIPESAALRLARDLAYFALAAAALPFAAAEAAFHAGSTVMMEARPV